MDELNDRERNTNQEPTTPFQTPVRGSSPAGSQHSAGQSSAGGWSKRTADQDTQPIHHTESGWNRQQSNAAGNGGNTEFHSGQNQTQGARNPYSEWNSKPGKKKKPKKPGNRKVKYIVAGVVLVLVAFIGGVAAGGARSDSQADTQEKQAAVQDTLPDDSTKVTISKTKTTGEGEDADDGKTSTQIYQEVSPSIVSIVVDDIMLGSEASGSGVIMSKDGYVITNQHVVSGGNKFTVVLDDGTQYEAELIGSDEQTDLAVLKVDPKEELTPAEFGESNELSVGDRCYAIGSPGGIEYQNTFTGGFVSAINRDVTINDRVMTLIQTDAAINPGSSGGALINKYGQVVGITSSKLSSSSMEEASFEGMGFAIPMSTAEEIVNKLIAYGRVTGRPAIGISGYDIDKNTAQYYDVPQGVLISSVDENSDAYEQGVQANDIITKVNGKEITCMSEINEIKEKLSAGDELTLTVYRSGKSKDIKITLMDEADLSSNSSSSSQQQENGYGYSQNPFSGYGYDENSQQNGYGYGFGFAN